jgi:hypothetical protein
VLGSSLPSVHGPGRCPCIATVPRSRLTAVRSSSEPVSPRCLWGQASGRMVNPLGGILSRAPRVARSSSRCPASRSGQRRVVSRLRTRLQPVCCKGAASPPNDCGGRHALDHPQSTRTSGRQVRPDCCDRPTPGLRSDPPHRPMARSDRRPPRRRPLLALRRAVLVGDHRPADVPA